MRGSHTLTDTCITLAILHYTDTTLYSPFTQVKNHTKKKSKTHFDCLPFHFTHKAKPEAWNTKIQNPSLTIIIPLIQTIIKNLLKTSSPKSQNYTIISITPLSYTRISTTLHRRRTHVQTMACHDGKHPQNSWPTLSFRPWTAVDW